MKKAHAQLDEACFNPLHCGAVVASNAINDRMVVAYNVSIPFIAGQWSLRGWGRRAGEGRAVSIPFIAGQWSLREEGPPGSPPRDVFQSPSLRGSGRFPCSRRARANPPAGVSIPFIAGQWSLQGGERYEARHGRDVSIPFIAGQWSLRECGGAARRRARMFQSPSLRGSGRFA